MTTKQQEQIKKRHREVVNKQYRIIRIKNDTDELLKAYKERYNISSLDNVIRHLLGA